MEDADVVDVVLIMNIREEAFFVPTAEALADSGKVSLPDVEQPGARRMEVSVQAEALLAEGIILVLEFRPFHFDEQWGSLNMDAA